VQLRLNQSWTPSPDDTPFTRLGGEAGIRALVEDFYDAMEKHEPALAKLHRLDAEGRIAREFRDRFALFLIGWLGGPDDYQQQHGHPRLRMRHGHVPVDNPMRDAWLHSMRLALDARQVDPGVRSWLDGRFAEVADFLRNVPSAP
jgi:hemoglobin